MKALLTDPVCAFDLETTGTDVDTDRIVTACVALLQPAEPTWKVQPHTWLADPGIDIPEGATAVHGITTAYAKEHGQDPAETVDQVATLLARNVFVQIPIVAANAAFDLTLLDRECRRHALPTVDERAGHPAVVVDVMVLDRHLDPWRKGGRKLTDLCSTYNVRIDGAHDSTFDALAAARIAYRLAQWSQLDHAELVRMYRDPQIRNRYGERHQPSDIADRFLALGRLTLPQLHTAQVRWRAEQVRSLHAYLAKKSAREGAEPPGPMYEQWPVVPVGAATCLAEEVPEWTV